MDAWGVETSRARDSRFIIRGDADKRRHLGGNRWLVGQSGKRLEKRPKVRQRLRSHLPSQNEGQRDQDAIIIGSLYRKGQAAILDSVKYYLQAGRKLTQKKDSLPHGKWVPWLRGNADVLGFRHRTTASRLMKAAAANDASTHHLNDSEAIRIDRKLWGNLAAASMSEPEFNEFGSDKKKSPTKRSATELIDRCIEDVHAIIEHVITDLRRAHAPRAKFELLFEALGEIIVDLRRQALDS
jgi:hypothetical protein